MITWTYIAMAVVVPLGVGIWLAFRGLRGRHGFPSCGKCGYNVTGSIGSATRCPECGSPFAEVGIARPGGRYRPFMTIGGLILIVFAVGGVGTALSAWQAQRARSQAVMIRMQAVGTAATTKPAVGDAVSSEEDQHVRP